MVASSATILIAGTFEEWSIEHSYVRAFRRAGAHVETFDWWRDVLPEAPNLAARRYIWPLIVRRLNARLVKRARLVSPDLVLVFKGLHVTSETVDRIRRIGAAAFCFNPDNPFNPSVTSTSDQLRDAMPAWDCYFTWGRFLVDRLHSVGARRVEYLPFAWDPERHPHREPAAPPRYGTCFVGNYSRHRERWLSAIADLNLAVWGPGWAQADRSLRHCIRGGTLSGEPFSLVTSQSTVALNVIDPWNLPGHNMRTFEIPGCGGLQLATASAETAELFRAEEEILFFRTQSELREKVLEVTSSGELARSIADAGHALARSHTFDVRARRILDVLHETRSP
jgi:spore maturation protein CgeB